MDEDANNIAVDINHDYKVIEINPEEISSLVKAVCFRFGISDAAININVVDDERIREINEKFLKHDWPTDVVSFDLTGEVDASKAFEIIVNGQMAVGQAKSRSHSPQAELALYITHGLLHNLGFDDSGEQAAEKMHTAEDEILQQLGYGIIYRSEAKDV